MCRLSVDENVWIGIILYYIYLANKAWIDLGFKSIFDNQNIN